MADKDDTDINEDDTGESAPDDSDAEGSEDGEGEDGEGRKKSKLPIIIVGVIALLGIAVAGLYFTGMLDSLLGKSSHECVEVKDDHGEVIEECPEEEAHADAGDHGGGPGDGHGGGGLFVKIPPILVNLNSSDGVPRYLKLTVELEMYSAADVGAVEAVIPRVVDQFQAYLRELRVKDLRGSAGMYRLQMELLWRVNQAAAPVKVKDVLFQEMLIQ
ncbi:MAG: flagellar basal body-associated FliL family protein [Alphaproteobacteria bacterium]